MNLQCVLYRMLTDESLGDIFACLYGDIRAGCILCHMKYHVHAIQYGRFRPLFLTCQQITGKLKTE